MSSDNNSDMAEVENSTRLEKPPSRNYASSDNLSSGTFDEEESFEDEVLDVNAAQHPTANKIVKTLSHISRIITFKEDSLNEDNFEINEKTGYLVYLKDSPLKPRNWTTKKKLLHTMIYGLVTFAAQLNSTSMSPPLFIDLAKAEFGIGREVTMLTITLYILGLALGPMTFAPLSEIYGRKIGVFIPFLLSTVFTFSVATCYNVPSLMIYRFLCGFFAGAPIVSSGGVLADMFEGMPKERGMYLAFYSVFVSLGPSTGPTISSLLMNSQSKEASWRIPQYFIGLFNLTLFFIGELFVEETFTPVLLARKAKELRMKTKHWSIHCHRDSWQLEFTDIITKHLIRPFAMLFTPICFTIVLFASYVYGILFLYITTLGVAFNMTRNWQNTVATLPNFALLTGILIGCCCNVIWSGIYGNLVKKNNGVAVPEFRFPIMMVAGPLMPIGIFIFAWTSTPDIHWIVPMIGILLTGIGFITIFQGCLNYLVDTFSKYAASAIAANTFVRSVFAACFPLFLKQLFENLGVKWGGLVIGFIALGMIPIPFVFFTYGKSIREKYSYKGI